MSDATLRNALRAYREAESVGATVLAAEGLANAVAEQVTIPPTPCTRCGRIIPLVWPDMQASNLAEALYIYFDGGYGAFIDPLGRLKVEATFCHDCAHWLVESDPCFVRLFEDEHPRTHTETA